MKIKRSTASLIARSLVESFNIELMKTLADKLIEGYNLHQRTGVPENIPIQKSQAAKQIADDMFNDNLVTHFISLLVDVHYNGLMGRKHPIKQIGDLIREIQDYGYVYDSKNRMFVEDSNIRQTRNWGVLRENQEYLFSFLRLDIVGNTKLVKKYPYKLIQETYSKLHDIVKHAVTKRVGRIWNWEGDGGLVAFHFKDRNLLAVLSGMEIINRIFLFNRMECKLNQPLQVRLAVHTGPFDYSDDEEEIKKSDTIKKIIELESKHTSPNTVTVSDTTSITLDPILVDQLTTFSGGSRKKYYKYELNWEK